MVTYFNRKDLVSFGEYLLSERRTRLRTASYERDVKDFEEGKCSAPLPLEDRLQIVWHADVENWLEESLKPKDSSN